MGGAKAEAHTAEYVDPYALLSPEDAEFIKRYVRARLAKK